MTDKSWRALRKWKGITSTDCTAPTVEWPRGSTHLLSSPFRGPRWYTRVWAASPSFPPPEGAARPGPSRNHVRRARGAPCG
eukprot:9242132-Pyramimonas_sp.AAC.1